MLIYFLTAFSIGTCFISYYIIKYKPHETIVSGYNKYSNAISRLSNNNKPITFGCKVSLVYNFLKIILTILYYSIVQIWNKTLLSNECKKTLEYTYIIDGTKYIVIVYPQKGPSNVLQITDENDSDITDHILQYMGPSYDWHGKLISPNYFNAKTISYELFNGKTIVYKENELMDISLHFH